MSVGTAFVPLQNPCTTPLIQHARVATRSSQLGTWTGKLRRMSRPSTVA